MAQSLLSDRLNNIQASIAFKAPCRVATTVEIVLSGEQSIDGVDCVEGDRVLVKDQSDTLQNGIYMVQQTLWVRDLDFDGARDCVFGTLVPVASGTSQINTQWKVIGTNPITVGLQPITFEKSLRLSSPLTVVTLADYGGVGDGVVDNSDAFDAALQGNGPLFVPPGTWRVTRPILTTQYQKIYGAGQSTIIQADDNTYDIFNVFGNYCQLSDFRTMNGLCAIRLRGSTYVCVANKIRDISIFNAKYGIILDGYEDPNFPCYWNDFDNIEIESPITHGVWLTTSGAGDSPNANKFHKVRVYSHGANMTDGNGFWVQNGRFNNSFLDCEANLHADAHACFFMDDGADTNILFNCYCESQGAIYNFLMSVGSQNTMIFNGITASAGRAIEDLSGGKYTAINTGFPFKNWMDMTNITDVTLNKVQYNTRFYDGITAVTLDPTINYHLISASSGDVTVTLPNAEDAFGLEVTVIKSDNSAYGVEIVEDSGDGPNGRNWDLKDQYSSVTMQSNGAHWWIKSATLNYNNILFYDSAGTLVPDGTRDLYLVSAFAGDTVVQLPAPNTQAGRKYTIKRTDSTSNGLKVMMMTSGGADGREIHLSSIYDFVTVESNSADWWIVGASKNQNNSAFVTDATYNADLGVDVYFASAFSNAISFVLPPPDTDYAVNKIFTVKKVDSSGNAVTITISGGGNIDDVSSLTLSAYGDAYTMMSNGSQYFVLSNH